MQPNQGMARFKQAFESLGTALESGNLSDAKEALAQLQKNAPNRADQSDNPMAKKMEALSKAIDSGDVKAAQEAYADIKKAMASRPRGGEHHGPPPGGAPPGGANKSNSSSNSSKVYDKKDINKDGTVSWKEEQEYTAAHPDVTSETSSSTPSLSEKGQLDALA